MKHSTSKGIKKCNIPTQGVNDCANKMQQTVEVEIAFMKRFLSILDSPVAKILLGRS